MKSCCVITWNSDHLIYGLRFKKRGNQWLIEQLYSNDNSSADESFVQCLKLAHSSLGCRDSDYIAISGAMANASWVDLEMPDLPLNETVEALQFELPSLFPVSPDEIIWQCRKIAVNSNSRATIRIFAVPVSEWHKLLDDVEGAEITADEFITPFMAVDPVLAKENIFLADIDEFFYFETAGADGCRRMRNIAENHSVCFTGANDLQNDFISDSNIKDIDDKFMSALIIGKYLLSEKSNNSIALTELALPVHLKPARLKFLKTATLVTGIAALLCISAIGIRSWMDAYKRYKKVENEIFKVENQLQTLKVSNRKSTKRVKMLENILKSIPNDGKLLDVLCSLSSKLPHNMWITNYRVNGEKIYITIKSSNESSDIQKKLRSAKLFNLDNFRSRRNLDGTYYIYLQLKIRENS